MLVVSVFLIDAFALYHLQDSGCGGAFYRLLQYVAGQQVFEVVVVVVLVLLIKLQKQ